MAKKRTAGRVLELLTVLAGLLAFPYDRKNVALI